MLTDVEVVVAVALLVVVAAALLVVFSTGGGRVGAGVEVVVVFGGGGPPVSTMLGGRTHAMCAGGGPGGGWVEEEDVCGADGLRTGCCWSFCRGGPCKADGAAADCWLNNRPAGGEGETCKRYQQAHDLVERHLCTVLWLLRIFRHSCSF